MVVHRDIRTEPFTKTMLSPVAAVDTVPASGTLASWILMKLVPTWLIVTTTGGFEVQEHRYLQILQADPSNDGDRAKLPQR